MITERINLPDMKIEIALGDGIFNAGRFSGTGKTRLYNLLLSAKEFIEVSITMVTYNAGFKPSDYINIIERSDDNMVFLDRYDMYTSNELNSFIIELAKRKTVLVDLKDLNKIKIMCKRVSIDITEREAKIVEASNFIRRL